MPLFGPPDVEKPKAKGNVNGLIKASGYDNDRKVCWAAAETLSQIGDACAMEPLIGTLKDVRWATGASRGA